MNELSLVGAGKDQPIPQTDKERELIDGYFSSSDELLNKFEETKDPGPCFQRLRELVGVARVAALVKARLLHGMAERWISLGMKDSFLDKTQIEIGLSRETIERYIDVWETRANCPTKLLPRFDVRPMSDLYNVKRAYKSTKGKGRGLKYDEWRKLLSSPSSSSLAEETRSVLNKPARKNGLVIRLKRPGSDGIGATLEAWQNDTRVELGYLRVDYEGKSKEKQIRKAAIERIVENSGIVKE